MTYTFHHLVPVISQACSYHINSACLKLCRQVAAYLGPYLGMILNEKQTVSIGLMLLFSGESNAISTFRRLIDQLDAHSEKCHFISCFYTNS